VKQQIRYATGWDREPRFLIHDNDGTFGQYGKRQTVEQDECTRSYRCHLDRWLEEVMSVEGLPIPYSAPNASPTSSASCGRCARKALDHFIFLTADHIRRVVREYVRYYNGARPSQAIHGIPDPYPELRQPPPMTGKLVALPVLAAYCTTIGSSRRPQSGSALCGQSDRGNSAPLLNPLAVPR